MRAFETIAEATPERSVRRREGWHAAHIQEVLIENTPSSSLLYNGAQTVVDKKSSIQQQQDGKDAAKSEKGADAESKKQPQNPHSGSCRSTI